ncbi:B-box zinc finger protein 32-like [Musa acuminata AAA Group]|uniref:B-box zinc finger protein 32-like n=1 Tax=Musa acuminata AAA Group TaxID=214697 RepID=UPI0031E35E2E
MKQRPACELCDGEAAVFCGPDAAFLCWACDASVHGANFLVARHVRRVACNACRSLDTARHVSGATPQRVSPLCASCDPDPSPSHSAISSSSSSCLSTSESRAAHRAAKPAPPRRAAAKWQGRDADKRAAGVLLCWSRRMGLRSRRACMEVAARVVCACEEATAALPLRVALAAALWFATKLCKDETSPAERGADATLRRLEACSGVPARLILAAESRIARFAERVRVAEEGWAECS